MTDRRLGHFAAVMMACWGLALPLSASVALAADAVRFIERSPADPAAIPVAVEQEALAGAVLPAVLGDLVEAGRQLFRTKFTTADGAGRPLATQATIPTRFKHRREALFQRASGPDANACTSCHNDPADGGAGDFTANVFTSEGTESADFDTVDPQFSNERGTNHVFGSGLVELLAREMTADLGAQRTAVLAQARATGQSAKVELSTKGVGFGRLSVAPDGLVDVSAVEGIDADLVVRPFSQKGVIPSLRMFTLNALNAHHGIQGAERFGADMTAEDDFDGDGVASEFSPGQVSAMVAYQAALPPPVARAHAKPDWRDAGIRGQAVFERIGCAGCHISELPLDSLVFADPGPHDTAGTLAASDVSQPALYDLAGLDWAGQLRRDVEGRVLVPLFGDLKRHVISDNRHTHFGNELMGQGFVARDTFMTAELWGVADTGPYGHRGDVTSLGTVILHHGGEARAARDGFDALAAPERDDLISFLKTLRMPE